MKSKRPILLMMLAVLLVAMVVLPATAQAKLTFDQTLDKLFTDHYPQNLEAYFTSLGTNPDLGFRWAGTSAERAVSARVLKEYKTTGLVGAKLEKAPCDVFEFKSASLSFNNQTAVASTFGGVPGTPLEGITSELVYVGGGTAADYATVGDVTGRLVLVDKMMTSWWFNMPAFEAWHRGAAGVVVTAIADDPKYYSFSDDALGSFDGYYDTQAPPMVYISKTNGDALKQFIASAGPNAEATLKLDVGVTMAEDSGFGYNVIGVIPGSVQDGAMVVMDAHQDAHFRAGLDDTGALVNMLTIAKAMKMSGCKPKHDIVFLATRGEEFGHSNAYCEWCVGAWYAATHTHKAWAGRIRAVLSIELMATEGAPFNMKCTPELKPFFDKLVTDNAALLPYGSNVTTPAFSWNDQWTFTAAGAPSVMLSTDDDLYWTLYHTSFENSSLMDWPYLAQCAKLIQRMQQGFDTGLLPYSLKSRADDLAATVDADALTTAGAGDAVAARLTDAVAAFQTAADWYDANAAGMASEAATVNEALLAIEKDLNSNLTALSPWDATIYPHQQVLADVQGMNAALAAIKLASPDKDTALTALGGTYLTWYGIDFSYPVFLKELTRHDPGYYRINWGGQGQLPRPLDIMPEYRMIEAGEYGGAIIGLTTQCDYSLGDLDKRLARMAGVLESVTAQIDALQ